MLRLTTPIGPYEYIEIVLARIDWRTRQIDLQIAPVRRKVDSIEYAKTPAPGSEDAPLVPPVLLTIKLSDPKSESPLFTQFQRQVRRAFGLFRETLLQRFASEQVAWGEDLFSLACTVEDDPDDEDADLVLRQDLTNVVRKILDKASAEYGAELDGIKARRNNQVMRKGRG